MSMNHLKEKRKRNYISNPKILVLLILLIVCLLQTYNTGNFWYLVFDSLIFITSIVTSIKLHNWGKKQHQKKHSSDVIKKEIIRNMLILIIILAIKLLFIEYN